MTFAFDPKTLFDAIRAIKGAALTQADVDAVNAVIMPQPHADRRPIAWGAKVSPAFRETLWRWCEAVGANPDEAMTCMAWESGRTFSPSVKNMAGSGATGLIQFMPATAMALGTSVDALAAMTAEQQLDWVFKYFEPYRGRLKTLGDFYMAILWPKGVGKPDSYVLWDRAGRPTTYRQNMGLDVNKDGAITRGECLVKLNAMLAEGRRPENLA